MSSSTNQLAALLRKINHPSIPTFESLDAGASDGQSLASFGEPNQAFIKALSSFAATIAFLHDHDVAVGKIDPSKIIVRDDLSVLVTNVQDFVDPANAEIKQADIAQLLQWTNKVLDSADAIRQRITGNNDERLVRSVKEIVGSAQKRKTGARELAEELRNALWFDAPPKKERLRKRRPLVKLFVCLAIAGLAVGFIYKSSAATPQPKPQSSPKAADSVVIDKGLISINGERYAVGTPDDKILVGNWTCTQPTPALLQRSTNSVFVFDSWPAAGNQITPRKLASKEPISDITAGNECGALVATTPSGTLKLESKP